MRPLWDGVRALQGQTLTTLRGKPFTVLTVTDTLVTIIPKSTGKLRPVRRQEIEAAAHITGGPAALTATAVREAGASEMNPVYVVAILKALPAPPLTETATRTVAEALRRMAIWQEASAQETVAQETTAQETTAQKASKEER